MEYEIPIKIKEEIDIAYKLTKELGACIEKIIKEVNSLPLTSEEKLVYNKKIEEYINSSYVR